MESSITVIAPKTDLILLKKREMYKKIDKAIADIALKAYKRHQWYLTPELVVLSLFDKAVSNDEKAAIACELLKHARNV